MPSFDSARVPIHYEERGAGSPVVLVHGFAASIRGNWEMPGWINFLAKDYRVVALDCRGHGQSGKPHDPEAYGAEKMADDVIRMLDHLGIERSLLMGYSMGGAISLTLSVNHPKRFRAVVLGGVGTGLGGVTTPGRTESIIKALLAADKSTITEPIPRQFREFAEANRNDLEALAACMGRPRPEANLDALKTIKIPVMIVIGTKDDLVGSADQLAAAIPGCKLVKIEGRDHLSTVGDKRYKEAVAQFFTTAPA